MKYYLTMAMLGLLMGGLCLVLEVHPTSSPGIAMFGLFGAHEHGGGAAVWQGACEAMLEGMLA
jgi:xanthosine utilization system XapX-like protein